jgi:hypothetical protein
VLVRQSRSPLAMQAANHNSYTTALTPAVGRLQVRCQRSWSSEGCSRDRNVVLGRPIKTSMVEDGSWLHPMTDTGWVKRLLAKCGLEVPHVLLSLLEKWAQGFGNVGQPEVHRLAESIPVPLKLRLFKAEVSGQGVTTVGRLNGRNSCRWRST